MNFKPESTYQKCGVVMLPTKEKAEICLWTKILFNSGYCNKKNQIGSMTIGTYSKHDIEPINQHLYITSDDKIQDGDWYIDDTNTIRKSITSDEEYWAVREDYQKIIATTDKLLVGRKWVGMIDNEDVYEEVFLPQLSEFFIEKYADTYNKSNILTSVLVEYNIPECSDDLNKIDWETYYSLYEDSPEYTTDFDHDIMDWSFAEGKKYLRNFPYLNVNKDNTINIKPIKDSWSRDEVIQKLRHFDMTKGRDIPSKEFDKWIEENL